MLCGHKIPFGCVIREDLQQRRLAVPEILSWALSSTGSGEVKADP